MRKPRTGTVSHGTMRTEDLLEALSEELVAIDDGEAAAKLDADCQAWLDQEDDDRDEEEGMELVNELIDALNEHSPPFHYFGSHPGDGSDYGFWLDDEQFEQAVTDGDIVKVADLGEIERDFERVASASYIAVVSDHGNVTLYYPESVNFKECWAIV